MKLRPMTIKQGIIAGVVAIGMPAALAVPAGATGDHHDGGQHGAVATQQHERGDAKGHRDDRDWSDHRGDQDWRGDKGGHGHDSEQPGQAQLSQDDRTFLEGAAGVGLMEVLAGAQAMQRSQDPAVVAYATDVVRDHWIQLVRQVPLHLRYDVPLPQLTADQQAMLATLTAASDADFDATYLNLQVQGHEAALPMFRTAAAEADNPMVRKFAAKLVPKLEVHLALAQVLLGAVTSTPAPAPEPVQGTDAA